ncbi:MAG: hypothetical protein IJQ39_05990 [Thermoguttaceae bacterium]|nr:hypothetical protein [Thermoguttaceae bacterium]
MGNSDSDSRSKIETRQFTFAELPDYSELVNSKPTRFKTPQCSYDVNSWRKVYRLFCVYVMNIKPRHLKALKNLEETFLGRRVMFSNNIGDLIDPFKLSVSFYAELNLSAKSIIHNIIHIIQFCRLSPRQFVITIPVYVDESEFSQPEEVEDEQDEVNSQVAQPEQSLSHIVHFTLNGDIPDLAFSKPVSITINSRRCSVSQWRDIISETTRYIYENETESFRRYLYDNYGPKGSSNPLFSDKRSDLQKACRIDSNLYVETNFSFEDCVKKALLFIRYTNIAPSKVQIEYIPEGAVNSDNTTPAESAYFNTEPEEELEDVAVVENDASEQSQTETASIESDEDNDIPSADDSKSEEFENDKEWDFANDDDFVDLGMEFTDDGEPVLSPEHQKLIDAIEENYPEGIDLDDLDSVETIELASGVRCDEYIIDDLRMILAYNKADNVFYVPLRLADESTVKLMAAFITLNIDQYKAVSLSVIRDKFQDQLDYACDDEELLEFIEWYVSKEMDQKIAIYLVKNDDEFEDDGVCLPESITADEFCENFYGQIESYLEKTGSPVPMSQLRQRYPSLNETIISYALSDDRFGSSIQEEEKDEQLFYSIRSDSQLNDDAADEQKPEPEGETLSFTLDAPIPDLKFSKPVAMTIGDNRIELTLWREAITKTAEYLSENEPISFNSLVEEYGIKSKNRPLFSRNRSDILQPYPIGSELWVETKFDATDCVRKAKVFLGYCYIKLTKVRIEYIPGVANGSVGAPNLKTDNNSGSSSQQTLAELTKNPPELTPELQKLLQIIKENFPQGVQLEISKNILENASGVQCTDKIIDELKRFLFESLNVKGLFYLPSQIADESTLNDMTDFIDQQIKQYGAVATSIIREKFRYRLKFIISEDNEDLAIFIDKQINPRLKQKVQIVYKGNRKPKEKGKYSICLSENTSEKQFDKDISLQIKQYLQKRNCAVPIFELCSQFPHLDEDILTCYLDDDENEYLDDVFRVNYKWDEVSYYRTIDSLYLDDDFSEALTQAVAQLESNGGTATLATIGAKLDEYYDLESEDGQSAFREQFDLTDDAAFRFVIQRCYAGEVNHRWGTKTRFVPETSTGSIKLYDEFKKQYPNCGVFHENLFFEFAKKKTGSCNASSLILIHLRPHFIRLDIDHWIGIQAFKEQSNFSPKLADAIAERLTDQLGSRLFLSIGLLSDSFFEELPELRINDRLWQWNEYLLTSVSSLLIDDLVIVNDDPNAYQVTALLIPNNISIPNDLVEYAVKCYIQQNGSNASIDGAVDFLKQNRIRMKKTDQLVEQLEELLKEG